MIESQDGRQQVCCDTCPASYPNTYAAEDFAVMIADARAAGWSIRKVGPEADRTGGTNDLFGRPARIAGAAKRQPFTHACPDCRHADAQRHQ